MGKKRSIDSKIRSSQSFARLNYRQRDLWQGIIEVADDQGRMPGLPAYVRSLVWPSDDITLAEVEADMIALEQAGYIVRYTVSDMVYLQVVKWWIYQTMQWAGRSDYPAPDGWVDRLRYHSKDNVIITENWGSAGGYVAELPSKLPSEQGTPQSCRDVKDEVNGEGDVEASSGGTITPFRELSAAVVQYAKVSEYSGGPERWTKAIRQMLNAGATPEDIKDCVDDYTRKGMNIVGAGSLVNGVIIAISKRKRMAETTDLGGYTHA